MKKVHLAEKTATKLKEAFSLLSTNGNITIKEINSKLKKDHGGSITTNLIAAARRAIEAKQSFEEFVQELTGGPVTIDEKHHAVVKDEPQVSTSAEAEQEFADAFELLIQKARAAGYESCKSVDFSTGQIEKLHRPERTVVEPRVIPAETKDVRLKV